MEERLRAPSFAERVLAGNVKPAFDPATIALGVAVANATPEKSFPRFVDDAEGRTQPGAAPKLGAERLHLETNRQLANAIHLYQSVGFRHVSPDQVIPSPYARANVFMALVL